MSFRSGLLRRGTSSRLSPWMQKGRGTPVEGPASARALDGQTRNDALQASAADRGEGAGRRTGRTLDMTTMYDQAAGELVDVLGRMDEAAVDRAVETVARAKHVAVFGGGREGLQVKGFAMRLFHLGRSVSVVGDMTTPHLGAGDLLFVTCGPGEISTAVALVGVAKSAGAKVLVVTAQPGGRVPQMADEVLVLPAQTMADDQGDKVALLPMGSVFEGCLFLLFEVMILKLKERLNVSAEAMRANHTNLE